MSRQTQQEATTHEAMWGLGHWDQTVFWISVCLRAWFLVFLLVSSATIRGSEAFFCRHMRSPGHLYGAMVRQYGTGIERENSCQSTGIGWDQSSVEGSLLGDHVRGLESRWVCGRQNPFCVVQGNPKEPARCLGYPTLGSSQPSP